jgi:acetyltransferase
MVVIFGDPIPGASKIVTPGAAELAIFLGGADIERQETPLMHQQGIPVFPTPERGLAALHQFFRFEPQELAHPGHYQPPTAPGLRLMSTEESIKLVAKYGIPVAAAPLAETVEEAVALAEQFGFPVALKIASPDVAHKSDVGGVRLHLRDAQEVREEFSDLMATVLMNAKDARIEGVTVSPMAKPGGLEVIIGVFADPQYGAVLMFGLGGILTEIYQDVQFCLLPASEEELLRMIRSIKGYPLLAGFRGLSPKDQTALVEVMKCVSRLATSNPEIDQIDLNPVLVYERGVFVVDVRLFSRIPG